MPNTILPRLRPPLWFSNERNRANLYKASLASLFVYHILYQLPLDNQYKGQRPLRPRRNRTRHQLLPLDDLSNLLPQTYQGRLLLRLRLLARPWLRNLPRLKPQLQLDSSRYLLQQRRPLH